MSSWMIEESWFSRRWFWHFCVKSITELDTNHFPICEKTKWWRSVEKSQQIGFLRINIRVNPTWVLRMKNSVNRENYYDACVANGLCVLLNRMRDPSVLQKCYLREDQTPFWHSQVLRGFLEEKKQETAI